MKKAACMVVFGLMVFIATAFGADADMAPKMGMADGMMGMDGAMGGPMMGCGDMMKMGGGMPGCDCMMQNGMHGDMTGPGMMRGMMGGNQRMMHLCMHRLGLDAAQKKEIAAVRMRTMKEMIRKRADMQIARLELKELLSKDPVDMKEVEAKLKQIEGIRTGMHLEMIKTMVRIKSKLTPDQKKKLREMMERRPMMGAADEAMPDEQNMQPPMSGPEEMQPDDREMEHMQ